MSDRKIVRVVLGENELVSVKDRLVVLFQKLELEQPKQPDDAETFPLMTLAEILAMPIKPLVDCVEDRASGLRYAVRVIGEVLAACGGFDLMRLVLGMVEEQLGDVGAVWLDHQWDGVEVPGMGEWVA